MARNLRLSGIPWRTLNQVIEGASGSSYVEENSKLDTSKLQRSNVTRFKQEAAVISNRDQVDRVVAKWIRLLLLPVVSMVSVYLCWFEYNGLWSIPPIVGRQMVLYSDVFSCLAWLPQIAINYKCKVRNFTPVTLHLARVCVFLLDFISYYLCLFCQDLSFFSLQTVSAVIHLVLVMQWAIYRKIKHE